jgi:hypothetical protein
MSVAKGCGSGYANGTGERTGESGKVEQVGVLDGTDSMISGTDGVLRWNRSGGLCKWRG